MGDASPDAPLPLEDLAGLRDLSADSSLVSDVPFDDPSAEVAPDALPDVLDAPITDSSSDAKRDVSSDVSLDAHPPVRVARLEVASGIALMEDGTLRHWGTSAIGVYDPTPVRFSSFMRDAVRVASGGAHMCAVLASGRVHCIGSNRSAQLGAQPYGDGMYRSLLVDEITTATEVCAGNEFTCALLADRTPRCWGWGFFVGIRVTDPPRLYVVPSVAPEGLTDIAGLAAGFRYACAVARDGHVYCWGDVPGLTGIRPDRPTLIGGLQDVIQISSQYQSTCALRRGGTVWCFGDIAHAIRPVEVPGLSGVAEVAVGTSHACARMEDGSVRCWGENRFGQLGDGTIALDVVTTPTVVRGLPPVIQVGTRGASTCALTTDHGVYCWGDNRSAELGVATPTSSQSSPVHVPIE